ncbi:hypothetical protein [Streptomyces lydicus]|uniref:hypothetical protein n=1 Tax=Streptomyces lydicus TaxID=47763 RepID=UPI00101056FD|nr:hypothetical protein [Streptomyces lydicus]MCZ1006350.1 hypothetical protein [Streptomyces lydicus]
MTRYAYVITRTDDDRDEEDRVLSLGTKILTDDQDPAAFAVDRLAQNRVEHSYYPGPRRISYWPHPDDQPLPRTAPPTAEHIDG